MNYELTQECIEETMYWYVKKDGEFVAGFLSFEDAEYFCKYKNKVVNKNRR
jgi:hypothetical protein